MPAGAKVGLGSTYCFTYNRIVEMGEMTRGRWHRVFPMDAVQGSQTTLIREVK